jgi:hypothetical protein
MALNGNQVLDPNNLDCGLPTDTCCVGMGGATPEEVATISKSVSSPATSKNVQDHNTGYYNGPGDS